jgi:CPA2 family monovalent cation:H+ antiporter-2
MGFIAARLRLPVLVGYLLAGIIIGPATPGFVADLELSSQLAEIGVMLLMFGVGLHFSLQELLAARHIAVPGAIVQIAVATLFGIAVTAFWGWSLAGSIVFGLALSVASTVVLLKALESRKLLETVNGRIAVGWLVVEDLVMVLVLVLLPALSLWLTGNVKGALQAGGDRSLLATTLLTLGQVSVFIAFMLVVGRRLFPWLLWQIARTGSRELFTLCVIATAVGIAYGSAELFGVSFALGAFFAGMVMRESPLSYRAAENRCRSELTVSASLAQIGEFSFILAGLGISLGIMPQESQSLILSGAIISIALNPLLFRAIEPAQPWIRSRSRLAQTLEHPDDPLAVLPMSVDLNRLTGQGFW